MRFLAIVLLSVAAAISYGILHDQVTARVCIEYFTIGHPRLIASESPTILALFWGVVATWWVGLLLGIPLAIAARLGKWPRLTWWDLLKPVAILMGTMAACALTAGVIAWFAWNSSANLAHLTGLEIPPEKRIYFVVDAVAHLTSYGVGFVGGLVVIIMTVFRRRSLCSSNP